MNKSGVPLFETLIGLALILNVATQPAYVGRMFFMALFWVGNAEFGHGLVNGVLMGLMLFATVIVVCVDRYYGVDIILERRSSWETDRNYGICSADEVTKNATKRQRDR